MRVIIVGAGEVGQTIANTLTATHEVVVIERDGELVEELTYDIDALVIQGDGTDLSTLQEAGIQDAEMVIASTDDDEVNIVTCGAAKTTGDVFTIARVKRHSLLLTWQGTEGAFGVDFMASSNLLTAEAIFRLSGFPGAQDVDSFIGGLVRMAEFEVYEDSPIVEQTVSDADRYDSLTFAALFRDDELIIPRGDTRIHSGDRVVVIGSSDSVGEFATDTVRAGNSDIEEVVIVGGTEIGFQTARLFAEHGYRPHVIEQDHDRAREIAEELPNASVWEHDATDMSFLKREHMDEADMVVAALGHDDRNLLVSILAKKLGVDRTISLIENTAYAELFEAVGIDVAISPREETAEEIIRFTRNDRTEKIAMLEHDLAEVLEVEIGPESEIVGLTIADAANEFPDCVVIGAISRGGKFVIPRGDTVFEAGDHVVLFTETSVLDDVTKLV
ncbi:Trk system potassium transporter TrkA [Natranaeroarchaeum sulfidigenes]|uniref:TrkA, K+ transport system, NAD-binding component n=1 Tax=Natranaeroarchaeum sulfidigenes TaxID=2784880 RepID=A0A897MH71_9EURY|nr:Trk system potassium transporter TrkA [Natranaeroarchaeum sulfidigenes]QSG01500.1 TrkA, K+ transport system, NAD-binding component [Natranaeroarchaeum sulfidigenes]